MNDSEWEGAENDAVFDTMLKSILKPPSDLQKNWDVNLIKLCDGFLQKIRRAIQEGCSYVDFVEAAMVVQSSAAVYAKKVDYLWVLLEKLLVTFQSKPTEDHEESGPAGQERPRKVRRTVRSLDGEDYSDMVLDLPDSRNIDLKQSRDDTVEEFEEADYFIQDLMNNKETRLSMPLYDMHDDMIGNLHDFRMNRRLVDSMWLVDTLPVFELRGQHNHSSMQDSDRQWEPEEQESPLPINNNSPCEPVLEPEQELTVAEVQEQLSSSDPRPPTPLPSAPTPPPPTPPPLSPGQSSEVEISRAAQTRNSTRCLNVVDVGVVSEELTNPCKVDIPDKPLVVHACARPECVFCGERHEKKGKKECCKSEEEIQCCLSGIEAMLLDDVIKPELTKLGGFRFSREFLLGLRKSQMRAIHEPACFADWTSCTLDDIKTMFEDDDEGEFRGFDLSLCEQFLQLDAIQSLQRNADEGVELDLEEVDTSQHEEEFPLSQEEVPLPVEIPNEGDSINALLSVSSPEPEPQSYTPWQGVDEVESRAARVMAWHDSLRPLLNGAEGRSHVDIHEYGSRLLAAFPPGRACCSLSLQQVLQDKPQEDTCRYFLATLMLANTRNVEIAKSDGSELAMDCVELTLLDRSRRHELMEEECASITTSDRSRKRKKGMPAVGRMAQPQQNSLVETPLRESPNRINIMSRGSTCRARITLPQTGSPRLAVPGPAKCPSDPQPGPSWACDTGDWASDTNDSVDLNDVRTLGANSGKRRKM